MTDEAARPTASAPPSSSPPVAGASAAPPLDAEHGYNTAFERLVDRGRVPIEAVGASDPAPTDPTPTDPAR